MTIFDIVFQPTEREVFCVDKKEVEEMLAVLHLLTEDEKKNVLRYIKHLKKERKRKKKP